MTSINQTQELEEGDLLDLDQTVIEEVNPNNDRRQSNDEDDILRFGQPIKEEQDDDTNLMLKEDN